MFVSDNIIEKVTCYWFPIFFPNLNTFSPTGFVPEMYINKIKIKCVMLPIKKNISHRGNINKCEINLKYSCKYMLLCTYFLKFLMFVSLIKMM